MKLDLYQIFYETYQTQYLDRNCIWYQNDLLTPLFENQVILDLFQTGKYRNASYCGVTSWRLFEKTGLTYEAIESFITANKTDCYVYGNYPPSFGIMSTGRTYIHEIVDRIYASGVIPYKNPGYEWVTCFCNFWIATPAVFEAYMKNFFIPINQLLYRDPEIRKILEEGFFVHRGNTYPRHTFVYEYLFGFFLFHNKHIRYTNIVNKIDSCGRPANEIFSKAINATVN